MSPRRIRPRMLDVAVATVALACVCTPLLPVVQAATRASNASEAPVVESGTSVDQRVLQTGIISNPIPGAFRRASSGTADGSISWDVYSTSNAGIKLVVNADRDPALRDATNGVDIADYASSPGAWSVGSADRRFGFSAVGTLALSRFGDGAKFRGFAGTRPIEVARRRGAPVPRTRTTLRLRAEYGRALQSNARPTATIRATAVLNL